MAHPLRTTSAYSRKRTSELSREIVIRSVSARRIDRLSRVFTIGLVGRIIGTGAERLSHLLQCVLQCVAERGTFRVGYRLGRIEVIFFVSCASQQNCTFMSALGHKRTFGHLRIMSAFPPKADIGRACRDVCFVPKANPHAADPKISVCLTRPAMGARLAQPLG
jgi:hypothetical protein